MNKEIIKKTLDFSMVPYKWALCCLSECSLQEKCMRYQMCLLAPDDITTSFCVLPTVMKQEKCPYFHPIEIVHAAAGFRGIFSEVKERHHADMRAEMAEFLGGGGTFYRYRNGERLLMPEQQEWIKDMFRRYGYTEEIVFDEYKDVYRFDD